MSSGPERPSNAMPGASAPADGNSFGALSLRFATCFSLAWLLFYASWAALPGVRSGSDQIYASALRAIREDTLYPADAEIRVAVFGSSKVQAGFVPDLFDARMPVPVHSYNLGLPNTTTFIDQLESLIARGQAPTHVFVMHGWKDRPEPPFWDDDALVSRLFPFRKLPRNLVLFGVRSLSSGGPVALYRASVGSVRQSRADRGYYFISGGSHFPGDRLPDGFALDGDSPARALARATHPEGKTFARLRDAMDGEGIQVFLIPSYVRPTAFAPPAPNADVARELGPYGIRVLGPDYWRPALRHFSDPEHLNPDGARCYTEKLAHLFATELRGGASGPRTPTLDPPACLETGDDA